MAEEHPRTPEGMRRGLAAGDAQSDHNVGQVCETCPDNWVETGAIDESTGKPIPNIPYKIFDIKTKKELASGVLDENGKSPRHQIPVPSTQLFVAYGTDEAIDEALTRAALKNNAVSEWRGFEAGLSREEFDRQHWERTRNGDMVAADRGFFGQAARGAAGVGRLPGAFGEAVFGDGAEAAAIDYYKPYRDEAWEQYQLATGARTASAGESFGAGIPQGATLGWDEEISAGLNNVFDKRSYEEIVEAQRQVLGQKQISNPGWYAGGEIAGTLPTVFIPVGGAATAGARGAATTGRAVAQGAKAAAIPGAALGGVSGAGHDEGGALERLDGAAIGAATGGIGAAILGGSGVLIARGISRTRIWARFRGRPAFGSLDNKAAREWYLNQEKLIPSKLNPNDPLVNQAKQAHGLRNEARTMARNLMSDRKLAEQLTRENPNLTWKQILEKTKNKGFSGDDVYKEIIQSSQRSRTSVNKKLGLE